MDEVVKVGMADWKITACPGKLMTLGLGSCVGICIYETKKKIIGMAHVMLPDSLAVRSNNNRAKFADTAIPDMVDAMVLAGAERKNLTAKLAGGAQMFAYTSNSDSMRVGARNADASRDTLRALRIALIADDTGGAYGRTIEFESANGALMIKTIGHGVHYL